MIFEMWTQQFVSFENGREPALVDVFPNELDTPKQLFSDKIKNLMGRRMTLAAITYVPYTMAEIVVVHVFTSS